MTNEQGCHPAAIRQLVLLPLLLASGCCCRAPIVKPGALDGLLYRVSHWQENRCICAKTQPALAPVVESPSGYLSDGPTLAGHTIAGHPGRQATDMVVEQEGTIIKLSAEIERLKTELESANQKLLEHELDLNTATKELQLAMNEFMIVREQIRQWEVGLSDLNAEYQASQRRYDASLADLEYRLRDVLKQWEADSLDDGSSVPRPELAPAEQS